MTIHRVKSSLGRSLANAGLWLLVSGALLLAGYIGFQWFQAPPKSADAEPLQWEGQALRLVRGTGEAAEESLVVSQLHPAGRAIAVAPKQGFNARDFRYLSLDQAGLTPAADLHFFWRTQEQPGKIRATKLAWSGDGQATFDLTNEPKWRGRIAEVGLAVTGTLRQPVTLRSIALQPHGIGPHLRAIWSEWTAFEGWSHSSINFIVGGPRNPILHPTPVAAAWVGLALLLLAASRMVGGGGWDWRAAGVVFLAGWLAVDARWQLDLFRQLDETGDRYAGKTWEEKRLAAEDGALFRFTQEVKDHLPEAPQRLFLATPMAERYRFHRLRAQYHLLPHNVYSSGWRSRQNRPPVSVAGLAGPGDYLVVLGPATERFEYDPAKRTIRYNLVQNGGFEDGRHAQRYCKRCSRGQYEITTETARSGRYALKQVGVDAKDKGEYDIRLPGRYFRSGEQYTYSLWAKLSPGYEGDTNTLHGRIFYKGRKNEAWSGRADRTITGWQRLSHTFTIRKDAPVRSVSLDVGYPTGVGTRYVDDIEVMAERQAERVYQGPQGTVYRLGPEPGPGRTGGEK